MANPVITCMVGLKKGLIYICVPGGDFAAESSQFAIVFSIGCLKHLTLDPFLQGRSLIRLLFEAGE